MPWVALTAIRVHATVLPVEADSENSRRLASDFGCHFCFGESGPKQTSLPLDVATLHTSAAPRSSSVAVVAAQTSLATWASFSSSIHLEYYAAPFAGQTFTVDLNSPKCMETFDGRRTTMVDST